MDSDNMKTFHRVILEIKYIRLRQILVAFLIAFSALILLCFLAVDEESLAVSVKKLKRSFGKPGTIVVVVTNSRSGSTFLGEILKQNPETFYLFEPLLPYTAKCNVLKTDRLETLERMLRCDFNVSRQYQYAFSITNYTDQHAKCMNHTICFTTFDQKLLGQYSNLCSKKYGLEYEKFNPQSELCGYPLQTDLLTEMCKSSNTIAYKLIRLCSIESIEEIYRKLTKAGHDVYVIHLLRDPRAIMASRLKTGLEDVKTKNFLSKSSELCDHIAMNLQYVKQSKEADESGTRRNAIADGHYLRLRFEDVSTNPFSTARLIYRFIEEEYSPEIDSWIRDSQFYTDDLVYLTAQKHNVALQNQAKKMLMVLNEPYGTKRDPHQVLVKWRMSIPFRSAIQVQTRCEDVLKELDYKLFQTQEELSNFTISLH